MLVGLLAQSSVQSNFAVSEVPAHGASVRIGVPLMDFAHRYKELALAGGGRNSFVAIPFSSTGSKSKAFLATRGNPPDRRVRGFLGHVRRSSLVRDKTAACGEALLSGGVGSL